MCAAGRTVRPASSAGAGLTPQVRAAGAARIAEAVTTARVHIAAAATLAAEVERDCADGAVQVSRCYLEAPVRCPVDEKTAVSSLPGRARRIRPLPDQVTGVVVWREHVYHLIGADMRCEVDGPVVNSVELHAAIQFVDERAV